MGRKFNCIRCGVEEIGYVHCLNNHYVCDECHGKMAYQMIVKMSLLSKESNPLVIADKIIDKSQIPMLGCEHAWVAAGAFLAAIRNHGQIKITDDQIKEAIERTKKQAISAYCGLTGVCGIAPAIGACFSVILGAACPKDRETAITMHIVAQIVEAIAKQAGPSCCKNYLRTALKLSSELAKDYINVELPYKIDIHCSDSKRHPHGCREEKCDYYFSA